ncbi:MAG: cytochrome c oxidase subunit II [Bacteroidota bacterium]
MESQTLVNLIIFLLGFVFILVLVNMVLVFRLKDIDPFRKWNPTTINATLFMLFLIFGLIAAYVSTGNYEHLFSLVNDPASLHGVEIDKMFWNTMYVTILVVVLTNSLLFYYAFRYRQREGQKALYYPHNNKLELIWTIVPAVVMTILIASGVQTWHDVMQEAPEDAIEIEFYARQFDWTIRYQGEDKTFGQTHVKYIDPDMGNQLGFNFEDQAGHDDVVVTEIHVPVNTPIKMNIRSQDVLHSATLAHFRVKMDAVPGMPTSFWFVPTVTTKQMREKKNNPDFDYEMSCQQICGGGHWNMRRVLIVETQEEYEEWLNKQTPFYASYKEMNGIEDGSTNTASEEVPETTANEDELAAVVN